MRVVVVAGAFAPNRFGSPAVLAEQTAIGLRDLGHQVFVITATANDVIGSMSRWEVSGIPVVGVGVSTTAPCEPEASHEAEIAIEDRAAEILDVLRPDVVHFHSPAHLGAGPFRAARRLGFATVISCYGGRAAWPPEILNEADRVLVAGPAMLPGLIGWGVRPAQVRVVFNGAAPPGQRWQPGRREGPLRIGFLGGKDDDLGYAVLLQALGRLRRSDYELLVVDRATARGVRSIRDWDFNVPGLVRFLPRFPPPGRDGFFARIDVILALPLDPFSACLSVREALLRGIWPIASDIEANEQVIVPGSNGDLVPAGSIDRLADAIARALDGQTPLATPARNAIPTVADHVRSLESAYRELID